MQPFPYHLFSGGLSRFIVPVGSCCFGARRRMLNLFIVTITCVFSAIDYSSLGQMVRPQNRSFPCLIDACGVITTVMYRPPSALVIRLQDSQRTCLVRWFAGSLCWHPAWHLRQALKALSLRYTWTSSFLDSSSQSSSPAHHWALDSASMTPERSWKFGPQSLGISQSQELSEGANSQGLLL